MASRTISTEVYIALSVSHSSLSLECTMSLHFWCSTRQATMARLKKGWRTEEDREAAGFSGIQSFFKPINKRGWPRKRKKGNLASDDVIVAKTPPSNVVSMKGTRLVGSYACICFEGS